MAQVYQAMADAKLTRKDLLLTLGGGVDRRSGRLCGRNLSKGHSLCAGADLAFGAGGQLNVGGKVG